MELVKMLNQRIREVRQARGMSQVELARLQYQLPRLAGRGVQLSRQGGGGTGGI